jgi:hypothetical protein
MEADFVVASQLRGFLSEELVDYNLPELEDRIDEDIQFNTVVWCCGLQRIVPWFASPLEQEYQGTMRWRYASRLRASMIFLSVFFMTFVGYEYVHGTDRFYISGFARVVCAFFALLLALASSSVIHGGHLSSKWKYEMFSTFVIMFATGSTMALAVIDQDMRPPIDLVNVMTGMYGIAAAPFLRLSVIMMASTLVWTFYLIRLGHVYTQELYASLITLWVINAMGMFRAWQAEIISRKEVFGESKRFADDSAIAMIGKREEALLRSFMPGFLQNLLPGQLQVFENASFGLIRFPVLEELMSSTDQIIHKRQRFSNIMLQVDNACVKYDIRRIWTHSQFMAFVANVHTTRCTGHAPMFCAMTEIVEALSDLYNETPVVASVTSGPLRCCLAGSMCRSVLVDGRAYTDAMDCMTQDDVLQTEESGIYCGPKVRIDVMVATEGRRQVFDTSTNFNCARCIDHADTVERIETFVQTRPRSTTWKQYSAIDEEEDGILMMDFDSSDSEGYETLAWTMRQRQSQTDASALLVDRSRQIRGRRNVLVELWQRFGFETSHRIFNTRGFVMARIDASNRNDFWLQYRRRHWPLMLFWFVVGLVILMAFAGLDAKVFPSETRDSNYVRLLGGPLLFSLFTATYVLIRQATSRAVYIVPLAWVCILYTIVFVLYIVSPPEDTLYGGPRLFTVFAFAVFCRIPLPFFLVFLPLPLLSYGLARVLDSSGVDKDGRPLVDTSMQLGFQIVAATVGAFIVSWLDWNDDQRFFLKTMAYARTRYIRENKIDQLRDMLKFWLPRPFIQVVSSSVVNNNEIISVNNKAVGVLMLPSWFTIQQTAEACESIDQVVALSNEFEKICFCDKQYFVRHIGDRDPSDAFNGLFYQNDASIPQGTTHGLDVGSLFICALGTHSTTIGVWGTAVEGAMEQARNEATSSSSFVY